MDKVKLIPKITIVDFNNIGIISWMSAGGDFKVASYRFFTQLMSSQASGPIIFAADPPPQSHKSEDISERPLEIVIADGEQHLTSLLEKSVSLTEANMSKLAGLGCAKRKKINPHYKEGRKSIGKGVNFLIAMKAYLIDNGYLVLENEDLEADDIIAGLVNFIDGQHPVTIVSRDRDLWQLLSPTVDIYVGGDIKFMTRDKFILQYGFPPASFGLYKALVGDKSDNLEGVMTPVQAKRAIGAKSLVYELSYMPAEKEIFYRNLQIIDLSHNYYELSDLDKIKPFSDFDMVGFGEQHGIESYYKD